MIRFLAKIGIQQVLGTFPGGTRIYGLLQRHWTKSTGPDRESVLGKAAEAADYIERMGALGLPVEACRLHIDIGAGWLPTIPLVLYARGVQRQILFDLDPLMRLDAALGAAAILTDVIGAPFPAPPSAPTLTAWLGQMGMRYTAPAVPPYDLPSGSADLVTCSAVLMHPDRFGCKAIYAEAARLLRPGGVFIATIRHDDQYADSDPTLSRYNFLRYGHATWARWFHNRFTPFNRLRPADHRALLADLPFNIVSWDIEGGDASDLAELARIKVHPDFAAYPMEELTARHLTMVLQRREEQ